MGAFSSKKREQKLKEISSDIKEKTNRLSELMKSDIMENDDFEEQLKRLREQTSQETEKYKDAKRDLAFICQMVETDNTIMASQISDELVTDENYKYLADRECFGHNINMV